MQTGGGLCASLDSRIYSIIVFAWEGRVTMGPSLGDSQLLTSFYLLLDNVSLTKLIDGAVLLKLVFWRPGF